MKIIRRLGDWLDLYYQGTMNLLKASAPLAYGKLLDVGCGRKPYLDLFMPHVDQYIGIERLDTFQLTHDSHHRAKPECYYDGHRFPFEDHSFNTLVSFSLLEHTPEPSQLFSEMARVLKHKGLMIHHVPFSYRLHEEPHDYYRFTPHSLTHLCKTNGLVVERIVDQASLWSTISHKIITFLVFKGLRFSKVAQSVDKLGMEATYHDTPSYWLLPFIFPILVCIVMVTKGLERFFPVKGEPLAFLLIARKE